MNLNNFKPLQQNDRVIIVSINDPEIALPLGYSWEEVVEIIPSLEDVTIVLTHSSVVTSWDFLSQLTLRSYEVLDIMDQFTPIGTVMTKITLGDWQDNALLNTQFFSKDDMTYSFFDIKGKSEVKHRLIAVR